MRTSFMVLLALCGLAVFAPSPASAGAVRISQIYPGGGDSAVPTTTYRADYLELFNSSAAPVDVGGWLVAYDGGQPTSSYGCPGCNQAIPPNTIIAPCSYLLIQMSTAGLYGQALPTPDVILTGGRELGLVAGIALVNGGYPSGMCVSGPTLQDLVKWGSGNCYLGAPTSSPGTAWALMRRDGGMVDTQNNYDDFEFGVPGPRNSAAPGHAGCLSSPAAVSSWGQMKVFYR